MCEKCPKTFTSDANLQRHFKTETHNQKKEGEKQSLESDETREETIKGCPINMPMS